MPLSLPVDPPTARRLTGVVPQIMRSLEGDPGWSPAARSAIVVVVDGLGRGNLTARSGHARFLTAHLGKKDAARTVFPATTATDVAIALIVVIVVGAMRRGRTTRNSSDKARPAE